MPVRGCSSRSRSPRRHGALDSTPSVEREGGEGDWEPCRYCGERGPCEWGRDFEFCSFGCYRASCAGRDAVDWGFKEVLSWLCGEARLSRPKAAQFCQQAAVDSGTDLLAKITEGRLRRLGLNKNSARNAVALIEDLRQGAWLQPEPPLRELPLATVAEMGPSAGVAWRPVLRDLPHRSFAAYCPGAVDEAMAWQWFETLSEQLPWQDLHDSKYQEEGKAIPRRTIFMVEPGCRCTYRYSGVKVPPYPEPDFVARIREVCTGLAGLKEQPNACNINLYRDGRDSVGWHTDDEELFEANYNDACILSLTLGARRRFMIKRSSPGWRRAEASCVALGHGDLCTMEGRMQRYYLHAVPKEPRVAGPRINLTWRWITRHSQADGCPHRGPGN